MSLRGVISLVLYYIGDYVCEVMFRCDIRMMWVYKIYSNMMLWSHRFDVNDEVWCEPDNGLLLPKHLRNDDEL